MKFQSVRRLLPWRLRAWAGRPIAFLAYYLIAIIGFGIVDSLIAMNGRGFYAPYEYLDTSGLQVAKQLSKSISISLRQQTNLNTRTIDSYKIYPDSPTASFVDCTGSQLRFLIKYKMDRDVSVPQIGNEAGFILDITNNSTVLEQRQFVEIHPETVIPPPSEGEEIFPANSYGRMFERYAGKLFIILGPIGSQYLNDTRDACFGRLTGFGGSLPRMLYFSAITISTVGYGDIVPLTTLARFSAAFEAVVGIILAGLFLNRLTQDVRMVGSLRAKQGRQRKRK